MTFYQQKQYSSSLSIEEIGERLHSISEKYHTNTSDRFKFEGKITSSSFELKPTFDYSPNYQFRPEILGEIIPHDTDTTVILTFQLPKIFKNLFFYPRDDETNVVHLFFFAVPGSTRSVAPQYNGRSL